MLFLTGWLLFVYFPFVHMVWGGGLMAGWGVKDFAGGIVVHNIAGIAALASVLYVGRRKVLDRGPHSIPLVALGTGLLWFGWYGFNAGSTLAAVGADIASVAVTTTLAAGAAALAAMISGWTYPVYGKPDVGLTLNGALAGLVGITAGTADVSNLGAVIIGLVAGVIVVISIVGLERIGIDDPVGAISVHGVAGIWGVLAVGLFATDGGLFYGGGLSQLGAQTIGVLAIGAWAFGTSSIVFRVIARVWGLRVRPEEELAGLDRMEHGTDAYPEFMEQIAPGDLLDPVE
jgi:Amt family ammonium transporter